MTSPLPLQLHNSFPLRNTGRPESGVKMCPVLRVSTLVTSWIGYFRLRRATVEPTSAIQTSNYLSTTGEFLGKRSLYQRQVRGTV